MIDIFAYRHVPGELTAPSAKVVIKLSTVADRLVLGAVEAGFRSRSAIGAFNLHNMEYTHGVINAAEEERAPVILMIGEPRVRFAGLEMLTTICRHAAEAGRVPVAIALDHLKKLEYICRLIELGMGIMVDGSPHVNDRSVVICPSICNGYFHDQEVTAYRDLSNLFQSDYHNTLPDVEKQGGVLLQLRGVQDQLRVPPQQYFRIVSCGHIAEQHGAAFYVMGAYEPR